jgi:cob(I)alamin adenosyltransferase
MPKIYTKTGDKGQTSLLGGQKVSKAHLRIDAFGQIDELNSYMGLLAAYTINEPYKNFLLGLQHQLFNLGALLAVEGSPPFPLPPITLTEIEAIEKEIDAFTKILLPLKHFILPGGHREVAFCHIARCVCRRAERAMVHLNETDPLDPLLLAYINRLSDYLFVFARIMTKNLGAEEIIWEGKQ